MLRNNTNLIGQRFSRLLVIDKYSKDRHGTKYICKCDCGNTVILYNYMLLSNRTKSCGCYRKEFARDMGLSRVQWLKNRFPDGFSNMYRNYKRGAEKRNLSFSIDKDDFYRLTQENCHYCNAAPGQIMYARSKYTTFIYNGIDRIDNRYGYSLSNCVPCCKWCNQAKSDMSIQEFNDWCKRFYNNYISKIL